MAVLDPGMNEVDETRAGPAWASVTTLAEHEGAVPSVRHACMACADAVAAVGAALSLARGGGPRELVFVTDPCAGELQELQFMLGEGPCVDALGGSRAVLAPDLSSAGSQFRWPAFAPAAVRRGVRAVVSFPVQGGTIQSGVLGVYRLLAGPPSRGEMADALACASVALALACDDQGSSTSGPDPAPRRSWMRPGNERPGGWGTFVPGMAPGDRPSWRCDEATAGQPAAARSRITRTAAASQTRLR